MNTPPRALAQLIPSPFRKAFPADCFSKVKLDPRKPITIAKVIFPVGRSIVLDDDLVALIRTPIRPASDALDPRNYQTENPGPSRARSNTRPGDARGHSLGIEKSPGGVLQAPIAAPVILRRRSSKATKRDDGRLRVMSRGIDQDDFNRVYGGVIHADRLGLSLNFMLTLTEPMMEREKWAGPRRVAHWIKRTKGLRELIKDNDGTWACIGVREARPGGRHEHDHKLLTLNGGALEAVQRMVARLNHRAKSDHYARLSPVRPREITASGKILTPQSYLCKCALPEVYVGRPSFPYRDRNEFGSVFGERVFVSENLDATAIKAWEAARSHPTIIT